MNVSLAFLLKKFKRGEIIVKRIVYLIPFLIAFILMVSCQEKKSDIAEKEGLYEVTNQSSCVGCHTNKALLEQVAEPLEGSGGEAGEG